LDWVSSGSSKYPRLRDVSGNSLGLSGWLPASAAEQVIAFVRTVTLTSASAGTAVPVVADSEVPAGYAPYVTDFMARVNGTTPWATTATVKVQDTNGSPVDFATIAVAALTSQARIYRSSANVTVEDAMSLGTGGTASKGLQVKGDVNGTGSNLVLTITGFYKKAS
jgi:hypothetical protein